MATPFFEFKKFKIYHDKCAMKVGTDGVLLGAWTDVSDGKSILDIGTGSGLIAMMLAQRSEAVIDAIDIEKSAYLQASENTTNSVFKEQIVVHHTSLSEYAKKATTRYDLIVSNPPYFIYSLLSPVLERNLARHNDSLTLEELLEDSLRLLNPKGRIALILPSDQEELLKKQAELKKLYFLRKTYVIPTVGGNPKRLLVEFTPIKTECITGELVIEESRHCYTKQYRELTKDFYLKM